MLRTKTRRTRRVTRLLLIAMLACCTLLATRVAYATGTTIRVESASVSRGDTVRLPVVVEGNPGILGATLEITYEKGLTLTDAQSGEVLSALSMTKPGTLASPCKFTWDGVEIKSEDIRDGEILVLTFRVDESVADDAKLTVGVAGSSGAVLDGNLDEVDVSYVGGTVAIASWLPGDLDGNRQVNSRDVILARRHIVGGYDQTINIAAADVDDNLAVNSKDVILMRRFITGGYGVELKRSRLNTDGTYTDGGEDNPDPQLEPHVHSLVAVAQQNPTCTEDGHIAYWTCEGCGKLFSDAQGSTEITAGDTLLPAAHVVVIDQGVDPTTTSTGLTEGSHCAVCGTVFQEQQVLPKIQTDEYTISYDIANGDSYIASLALDNSQNRTSYFKGEQFDFAEPEIPAGYYFLGWFDKGKGGTEVMGVTAATAKNLKLYAHWELIPYDAQFESDLFLDTDKTSYTVRSGLVLPTPKLSNYIFVGWADDAGTMYGKRIQAGTTGDITLRANWTSERNKTYTNPNPKDPIIIENEDEDVILFAYEIGRIENVPQYVIKDFGYISGDGVTRNATETYSATTSQSMMEQLSNVVANATTNSSNWTLSSDWNETTSISEDWCKTNGYTREEAETVAKSESSNWNISNSQSGSSSSTSASSSTDGWSNEVKVNGSNKNSSTDGWKNSAELSAKVSGEYSAGASVGVDGFGANAGYKIGAEIGGKVAGEKTHSSTSEKTRGFEMGGSQSHTGTTSSSSTNTASWGSTASYGGSSTTSRSNTVSTALSETISQQKHYGQSYSHGGSESQGLATSTSTSSSDSYTSATTYNTETSESVTSSWTTAATKPGYHRWIVAGTAHVYGVVGYDIENKAFFVYTYSVMDDETHEFEDYSYTTAAYNDNENGVISFEVPYDEVMQVVSERVYASDGLKVNLKTGEVVGYTGSDTCVVIPEYYNAGSGDVVKITGFTKDAFAGNKDIVTVVLSDYIESIPDGAFAGCSSLSFVEGAGVTSIGARAFADCPSMEDCGVFSKVTNLGEGAFAGADRVYVNASNKDVALAAMASGAKGVVLNLRFLEDDVDALSGTTLTAPASLDYFELNGESHKVDGAAHVRTFSGLQVDSHAKETVLNKVDIQGTSALPVKLASSEVTLNQTSVSSPGVALALTADTARIGLRGTSTISSTSANAMISKNVRLYETASDVVGELVVPQKLLVCGAIDGRELLHCNAIETIDSKTFDAVLRTAVVRFDANGGTCDEELRTLTYGMAIGELPEPTWAHHGFEGWYLEGSDELVSASTVLSMSEDQTLVAHWKKDWTSDIADGVYSMPLAADTNYSLDVPGGAESAGKKLQLYPTNYSTAQQFRFVLNEDETYRIEFHNGNLCFESSGTNADGNPNVALAKYVGADTQKWYIEPNDEGSYSFRNKGNDLYIDNQGARAQTSNTIQCWRGNATRAQRFLLRREQYGLRDAGGSWMTAKAECERMGGHLATISSDAEQRTILSMLSSRPNLAILGESNKAHYWLGGYREGTTWKWVTGESFSYNNWATGEPNNSGGIEDKLHLYSDSGYWNDVKNETTDDDGYDTNKTYGYLVEWE